MTKTVKLYPSEKEIPIEEGQTVLTALEKAGLVLPNNCRAGACGECKIKVRSGEFDQGLVLDMALSPSEREEGYGLMCMAKLQSDVLEIEFSDEEGGVKLFPPKENMRFVLLEKSMSTHNIVKLRLRPLGREPMRFWPGQYISINDIDGKRPKRHYSIGNIPNSDNEVILYITKVEEGKTSGWVHEDLKVGESVVVDGPYGTFIGDPTADTPVLCLASGSGLAPITSLASAALLRGGFRKPATILFSARTENDLFETGLFKYLSSKFRNFKFRYTLTGDENTEGLKGRIPEILPELYPDLSNYSVYIAGNPDFVRDCQAKVKELGGKDELIHVEGFFNQ
ncbi:MAG: ferredoxin [Halobacteriovorax sp.]|nr:ferredoxin [Halobacteriovorax sp.]|tara:strand:+ start:34240 stop:35256 length:1017 start_codon:yes stop_codon:yes gene_type:complete